MLTVASRRMDFFTVYPVFTWILSLSFDHGPAVKYGPPPLLLGGFESPLLRFNLSLLFLKLNTF